MNTKLVEVLDPRDETKSIGYEEQDSEGNVVDFFKYANHKQWHEALQESPSDSMVEVRKLDKKTDGTGKTSKYVPITIQEALADIFFRECDIIDEKIELYHHEIIDDWTKKTMKPNAQITMHVKLQILPNYPNAEHRIISGVAGRQIQQKANSLEYNSPAVQSAAKSNALTMFANIFGRNLNRDFNNNYSFTRKKD